MFENWASFSRTFLSYKFIPMKQIVNILYLDILHYILWNIEIKIEKDKRQWSIYEIRASDV